MTVFGNIINRFYSVTCLYITLFVIFSVSVRYQGIFVISHLKIYGKLIGYHEIHQNHVVMFELLNPTEGLSVSFDKE